MHIERAMSLIKPIGIEMNLGDMLSDYLRKNSVWVLKRTFIEGLTENEAIKIYHEDFEKLSQISLLYPRGVIETMTCGPVEVIEIEGFDSRNILRRVIGSVENPSDTIRWNLANRVENNKRLTKMLEKQISLPFDRAILIANGIHGTKDEKEFAIMNNLDLFQETR